MSFSVSDEMNLFSQELQLAKEVGFVQHTSKYQAQELFAFHPGLRS
ncbi:hypothetical protein JFV29_11320 [Peribacillus sp. TH16]|nr:hypothetical protein [Peribacillus sp. TH16]MBK5482492.1 hypothetical protein [Peribacillus sp. TH16]